METENLMMPTLDGLQSEQKIKTDFGDGRDIKRVPYGSAHIKNQVVE